MEKTFERVTERHGGKAKMDQRETFEQVESTFNGDNIKPRKGTDNSVLRNICGLEG